MAGVRQRPTNLVNVHFGRCGIASVPSSDEIFHDRHIRSPTNAHHHLLAVSHAPSSSGSGSVAPPPNRPPSATSHPTLDLDTLHRTETEPHRGTDRDRETRDRETAVQTRTRRTDRNRHRNRHRHSHRQTGTDKQTDKQTDQDRDREERRQGETETEARTDTHTLTVTPPTSWLTPTSSLVLRAARPVTSDAESRRDLPSHPTPRSCCCSCDMLAFSCWIRQQWRTTTMHNMT
mmetsp:Transcript_11397/g.26546  ORF Transcript_11397/g.26546 Transcript_11397/m.26546 type:complete len:233 (-) Transcript_11397:723-1421(-)